MTFLSCVDDNRNCGWRVFSPLAFRSRDRRMLIWCKALATVTCLRSAGSVSDPRSGAGRFRWAISILLSFSAMGSTASVCSGCGDRPAGKVEHSSCTNSMSDRMTRVTDAWYQRSGFIRDSAIERVYFLGRVTEILECAPPRLWAQKFIGIRRAGQPQAKKTPTSANWKTTERIRHSSYWTVSLTADAIELRNEDSRATITVTCRDVEELRKSDEPRFPYVLKTVDADTMLYVMLYHPVFEGLGWVAMANKATGKTVWSRDLAVLHEGIVQGYTRHYADLVPVTNGVYVFGITNTRWYIQSMAKHDGAVIVSSGTLRSRPRGNTDLKGEASGRNGAEKRERKWSLEERSRGLKKDGAPLKETSRKDDQ